MEQLLNTSDIAEKRKTDATSNTTEAFEHLYVNTTEDLEHVFGASEIYGRKFSIGLLIYVIVMGIALLFAITSNGLVIYCVVRFSKLRTVTNIFICNLSVSDMLLAGFVMPQRLHDVFHDKAFYHEGNF